MAEQPENEDWTAVARAIDDRLTETAMTQLDVAGRAEVSLSTISELRRGVSTRRRRPQTLAAVSQALGWPPDYLRRVLHGDQPEPHPVETNDRVLQVLDEIRADLADLRNRVVALEQREARADAQSEPDGPH